ncbi:hypothetical protein J2X84_005782 [Pseudomonas corrugata]|jgi:hypothetical protein|nr:hypothetical protein [Pseudomonas corrugata]
MRLRYAIRHLTFQSGVRFSLLVDQVSSIPTARADLVHRV